MELLFLVIFLIAFLALNSILENIGWIGSIFIIIILSTFIRQIRNIREFGFDFAEFMIILLKLGAIALTIWLMVQ